VATASPSLCKDRSRRALTLNSQMMETCHTHIGESERGLLNPAAWTDAPGGTWATAAPLYNNYRGQRQPAEPMSFARNFRVGKEGKYIRRWRRSSRSTCSTSRSTSRSTLTPMAPVDISDRSPQGT
jgi:hypothetical protein